MILASLMLMQAVYAPETEAVMKRPRAAEASPPESRAQVNAMALYLPAEIAEKLQHCVDVAGDDPEKGVKLAQQWAREGGGFSADQCLGFAHARAERWVDAAMAFDSAAEGAHKAGAKPDAARLWAQAGNAALAGAMAAKARDYFDKAIVTGLPDGLPLGEAYLDRARARVALDDLPGARADLDKALGSAPQDPLAWLLSATLARRMDDLARAATDIAEAKRRAPDDPSVALEAGNIAILSGAEGDARTEWMRVLTLAPSGEQAAAARDHLARLEK